MPVGDVFIKYKFNNLKKYTVFLIYKYIESYIMTFLINLKYNIKIYMVLNLVLW